MLAWHFVSRSQHLGHGDDRLVRAGLTYRHEGPLVLCRSGLHASERIIDALKYSPGSCLCRVRLGGEIIKGDDKVVATSREVLSVTNVAPQLREFARWCALLVIHLWDAPAVVREYLETGDQGLAVAARDAAWVAAQATMRNAAPSAAREAARAAAWAATWAAARAALNAARVAAWAAARDAAWDAAWGATRDATREKQNKKLEEIVADMRVF